MTQIEALRALAKRWVELGKYMASDQAEQAYRRCQGDLDTLIDTFRTTEQGDQIPAVIDDIEALAQTQERLSSGHNDTELARGAAIGLRRAVELLKALPATTEPTSLLDAIPEGWRFSWAEVVNGTFMVCLEGFIFERAKGTTFEHALKAVIQKAKQHDRTPTPTTTPHNPDQATNHPPKRDHAG